MTRAAATSLGKLQDLASARAPDPAIFDEHPPSFWRAEISNNSLDAYVTRMARSSLQNYAADAEAGVSFQPSHDIYAESLGASLTGQYSGPQGNGVARVLADFYALGGYDPAVDRFLVRARAGIAKDVSIGFYGGQMRCSLCGADAIQFFGMSFLGCDHVPGLEYEVTGPSYQPDSGVPTPGAATDAAGTESRARKGKARMELAFLWVEQAHLAEVSTVYEGATPGAEIVGMKATALADAGRLNPEQARLLETRFRLKLPVAHARWPGATLPPSAAKEKLMDPITELRALLAADGAEVPEDADAVLAQVRGALWAGREATVEQARLTGEADRLRGELATAQEQVTTLMPLAADGRAYRAQLTEVALAEGVRAHGEAFDRERWAQRFAAADLAFITDMTAEWAPKAAARFPGGRQTTAGDEPRDTATGTSRPATAYRT